MPHACLMCATPCIMRVSHPPITPRAVARTHAQLVCDVPLVDGGKKTNAAAHTITIDPKPHAGACGRYRRQMKKEDFRDKWIAAAP